MTSKRTSVNADTDGSPEFRRYSALMKASFIAIEIDLTLIAFKYLLSLYTGNSLLLADAFHSGGDLAVSLTVMLSVIVSYSFNNSPRARGIEALVVFIIALSLIIGSIRMFWFVVSSRETGFIVSSDIPSVIAILGVSLILLITLFASVFKSRIGKTHDSDIFSAESDHTYSDFLTSAGVWISLFLGYFGCQVAWIMSIIISIIVFLIGVRMLFKVWRRSGIKFKRPFGDRAFISAPMRESLQQIGHSAGSYIQRINKTALVVQRFPATIILNNLKTHLLVNAGLIILLYLGTGFYQVKLYQTGLELLFGQVVEKNKPGLHYHLPRPFGDRVLVDTSVPIRLESGFRTNVSTEDAEPDVYLWEIQHKGGRYRKVMKEAMSISGDENLLDSNFLCYYRIIDPMKYAMDNKDTHEILRSLFTYTINAVISRYPTEFLITEGRQRVQRELLPAMRSAVADLSMGVRIDHVYMQEVHPPIDVIPQYRAVASAREKKNRIIHEAASYANELLPRARAQAHSILATSEADFQTQKLAARGETDCFRLKQKVFDRYAPSQKTRMKWEIIEESISGKQLFMIPSKAKRRHYLKP